MPNQRWSNHMGDGQDHKFRDEPFGNRALGRKNSFQKNPLEGQAMINISKAITFSCLILLHVHDNPVKQELLSQKPSPPFYNSMPLLLLVSLLRITSSNILLSRNLPSKKHEQTEEEFQSSQYTVRKESYEKSFEHRERNKIQIKVQFLSIKLERINLEWLMYLLMTISCLPIKYS